LVRRLCAHSKVVGASGQFVGPHVAARAARKNGAEYTVDPERQQADEAEGKMTLRKKLLVGRAEAARGAQRPSPARATPGHGIHRHDDDGGATMMKYFDSFADGEPKHGRGNQRGRHVARRREQPPCDVPREDVGFTGCRVQMTTARCR
jgi:hypothetical protein